MLLERAMMAGWMRSAQMKTFSDRMFDLGAALGGAYKVGTMVLPFPYAQLLKWGLLLFVYSLPWVLVTDLQWMTVKK